MMFKKTRLFNKKRKLLGLNARLAAIRELHHHGIRSGSLVYHLCRTMEEIAKVEYDIAAFGKHEADSA